MQEIIMEYIAIWAPAITAVLATVASALLAFGKVKKAVNDLKQEETINQLKIKLTEQVKENKEIREQLDIVIDQLTKIENYRENK